MNGLLPIVDLLSLLSPGRMYGNGSELHKERFRWDIRKLSFTKRVDKLCNRLPREVMDGRSLSVFKRQLNNALTTILKVLVSLELIR